MKHVVRKAYWDYEKEEKWINDMTAKGMHLDNYSWCKYTFVEGEPGEYIYRLELLENTATHAESIAYLKFLEENGVEHVSSYMRWVYLRKKATEGPFEVYTDIESKMKYFKRVNSFWLSLSLAEITIGLANLGIWIANQTAIEEYSKFINVNLIGGAICTFIGLGCLSLSRPLRKKMRQLKNESHVHE